MNWLAVAIALAVTVVAYADGTSKFTMLVTAAALGWCVAFVVIGAQMGRRR